MSKKSSPLSLRLKLALAWNYVTLVSCVLVIVGYCLISNDGLDIDTSIDRMLVICAGITIGALASLTIYCFHKRKEKTAFAFIVMTLTNYGLFDVTMGAVSSTADTALDVIISYVFLVIDLCLVMYLLLSSEAKSQLKNK